MILAEETDRFVLPIPDYALAGELNGRLAGAQKAGRGPGPLGAPLLGWSSSSVTPGLGTCARSGVRYRLPEVRRCARR